MKTNSKHQIIRYIKFFQHHWLWLTVLLLGVLTLSANQTAWATSIQAPHNQTVPTVTPTTEATPVPTVTPTPAPTTASAVAESNDEAPLFQSTDLKASVSVIALNMREGDDTGSSIVGTVYLDTEIAVLARNADSTWFYVCCTDEDDLPGWVSSQFVSPVFDVLQTNELVPLYEEVVVVEPEPDPTAAPADSEQNTNSEAAEDVPDQSDGTEAPSASNEESDDAAESVVAEVANAGDASEAVTVEAVTVEAVTVELEPATLQFEMNYMPEFVWQGQEVQIEFIVTNVSNNPAINVHIRDELLSNFSLSYVTMDDENGILETSTSPNGGEIFTITWPELAPQQVVRAVVGLQIMADTPNGTAIDNLAAAGADNAPTVTGGMSVGMPPALLPDFR